MNQDVYVIIEHLQAQLADITYLMHAAARPLANTLGGKVVGVLLGHGAQDLASSLAADTVLYVDRPELAEFTPDAYAAVLAGVISDRAPRVVLLGHSSVGAELASLLSARLGLPLIGSCQRFSDQGNPISQFCGGKIMAELELPATTTLITLTPGGYRPEQGRAAKSAEVTAIEAPALEEPRVSLRRYIEPERGDTDIAKQAVLISVGRAIQNEANIALAEELAQALGGAVSASRPVVDQGWLPTSRLVGKSGKHVKPKLYLALGISGAPEHVEAITDSETIIAVNQDPAAPIFDVAKYGVAMDMFDLIEMLAKRLKEAAVA